jgi:hypothetical protein
VIRSIYPVATPQQLAAAVPHKTAKRTPWVLLGAIAVVAIIVGGVLAILLAPRLAPPCGMRCMPPGPPCGMHCPPPGPGRQLPGSDVQGGLLGLLRSPSPASGPLAPAYAYRSSQYGYSLEYDPSFPPTKIDAKEALWAHVSRSTGAPFMWAITAMPARGQSVQQIAKALQQGMSPDATLVYDVPGAEVGYTVGYGSIYDTTYTPAIGPTVRVRQVVIVAIKKGLAIAGLGLAPFVRDTEGHPNPAQTDVVFALDPIINSVVWPGDRQL